MYFSYKNSSTFLLAATFAVSSPLAMVSTTGLTAIFGSSISSCLAPALIATTSIYYSYKVNGNNLFNMNHIKAFLAMQSQLHQCYSTFKLVADLGSTIKYYLYNGKLNIKENIDLHNVLKFTGFILNGLNPITSLKNSVVGLFGDVVEKQISQTISKNIPSFVNNMANKTIKMAGMDKFLDWRTYDKSIESYEEMFKNILHYLDKSKSYLSFTHVSESNGSDLVLIKQDSLQKITIQTIDYIINLVNKISTFQESTQTALVESTQYAISLGWEMLENLESSISNDWEVVEKLPLSGCSLYGLLESVENSGWVL